MNEAMYGFNFSTADKACNRNDNPQNILSVCAILNGSLTGLTIFDYTQLRTKNNKLYYQELYNKGTAPDTEIKERGVNLYYYQLADGSMFAFHSPTTTCTLGDKSINELMQETSFHRYCLGWIDVNGISLPNREVRCSDGKSHTRDITADCTVPAKLITDVFPVVFYDGTVVPASCSCKICIANSKIVEIL